MSCKEYWDIDLNTGHMAHTSGLYAYVTGKASPSGGLKCVGPFSSYTKRLSQQDFYDYTAAAVRAVESIERYSDSYCLWGTYSNSFSSHEHDIQILGEDFKFIANPSLRSCVLVSGDDPDQTALAYLLREWLVCGEPNTIRHQLGLTFRFHERFSGKEQISCSVALSDRAIDMEAIWEKLTELSIRSLCTTALCVLNKIHPSNENRHKKARMDIALSGIVFA